ncbi:MAG: hypothetical protein KDK03_09625 [Rhodobacteraceae bacterium]|nr:hypothetical protein [Paracoccaceae bacterium]
MWFWRTIGGRIVLFLMLALTPVGLIAVIQTREVGEQFRQQAEAALAATTAEAVQRERRLIQQAFGATEALDPAVKPLLDDPARCSALFRDYVKAARVFLEAGVLSPDGHVSCLSTGETRDWSASGAIGPLMQDPKPNVDVRSGDLFGSPFGGRPVISIRRPIMVDGVFRGYIFISMAHASVLWDEPGPESGGPISLVTVTATGDVLMTANGEDETLLDAMPADARLTGLHGARTQTFTTRNAQGQLRNFAVVAILPGTVYAIGSRAARPYFSANAFLPFTIPAPVFPVMMWLISLGVAYAAVHRFAIRHVRTLQRAMQRFELDRRLPPHRRRKDMPAEFGAIFETFEHMAETVIYDEAKMEDAMREKNVLLREVHHRVKNNLQLISSIMNMQIRQIRSREGRAALVQLQERVLGLAAIHRNLYQSENLARVNADVLLGEMIRQIMVVGGNGPNDMAIDTAFAPVTLDPDQAVPLSLLAVEAMTNALKYGGRTEAGAEWIKVRLVRRDGETLEFSVENTLGSEPVEDTATGSGLGGNLIDAFAAQLGGRAERCQTEESFRLTVAFERNPEEECTESPSCALAPGHPPEDLA